MCWAKRSCHRRARLRRRQPGHRPTEPPAHRATQRDAGDPERPQRQRPRNHLYAVAADDGGELLVAVRRALACSTAKTMLMGRREGGAGRPRVMKPEAAHADLSDRVTPHLSPEVAALHHLPLDRLGARSGRPRAPSARRGRRRPESARSDHGWLRRSAVSPGLGSGWGADGVRANCPAHQSGPV